MKNNYKQFGPFAYGDPRFLAGGSAACQLSYSDDTLRLNDGNVVCPDTDLKSGALDVMKRLGQSVSYGKSGYHGNYQTNGFVGRQDLSMPTVGVEVETVMRECTSEYSQRFTRSVYSNWFHAESDGSLDQAHRGTYGYELVTTVLPARLYRDIAVWTGFQNLVSPLLKSYMSNETGLHVHVGMNWFENTKLPATSPEIIRLIGKILTTRVYYSFLPRSLAQRVFLRNSDLHYCHETSNHTMSCPLKKTTGHQVLDDAMGILMSTSDSSCVECAWLRHACDLIGGNVAGDISSLSATFGRSLSSGALCYGHDSEVNAHPKLTLEFRRGKGTTNALSIHRMVELCVLTVMYAGHVIDNPEEIVSSEKYLSYVIENTKSQALRFLAEKEIAKCA